MKTTKTKRKFKFDPAKAGRALQRAREKLRKHGSPLDSMTKEEIVQMMRKVREELWKEKLAFRH